MIRTAVFVPEGQVTLGIHEYITTEPSVSLVATPACRSQAESTNEIKEYVVYVNEEELSI